MSIDQSILESAWERHQAGDLPKAELLYRKFLSQYPQHPQGLFLLGYLASQVNQDEAAIELMQQAIAFDSNNASYYLHLAGLQGKIGALPQAVASYHRAIALQPDLIDAYNNLGNVYRVQGDLESAERAYRTAIEHKGDFAEAHGNLGLVLHEQHRYEESMAAYQRSLGIRSDLAAIHHNLGNLERDLGKFEVARQSYERAIQLRPDLAESHNNLGNIFREQAKLESALQAYRNALAASPNYSEAHYNLASVLQELGFPDEAIPAYRRALELRPNRGAIALVNQLQCACDWRDLDRWVQPLIATVDNERELSPEHLIAPFLFIGLPVATTHRQQLKSAETWVKRIRAFTDTVEKKYTFSNRASTSKIKIGYLSADFHEHAIAWLIAEVFEAHDRERFEVNAYSFGIDDQSSIRHRIAKACPRFRDISKLSFCESAELIANDEIDILIDMNGYTQFSRTEIAALRPAPIQVSYLGYPGTMGADFIDYILVDDYIVPMDQQPYFTERLVQLPGCYQANDRFLEIAERTPSRRECGLPDDGIVFCSFNNSYKISLIMFDIWMRVLRDVPKSVLWLLISSQTAIDNLRREANQRGVDGNRLIIAPRTSHAEHMARHRLADLFIDSFPYNAHTTASDALRMGVPLVTYSGKTFSSRVAGSLVRAAGLPELITNSLEDYENLVRQLAKNPDELLMLRRRLAANLIDNPQFDGRVITKHLESAYTQMWELYQRGMPPQPMVISKS